MDARAAFPHGHYPVKIEETRFSYSAYAAELDRNSSGIATFKANQQSAFESERQRWRDAGLDTFIADEAVAADARVMPAGHFGVASSVPGNIWKILVENGTKVKAGQPVAIIESMKMEITVIAHAAGVVRELRASPGRTIKSGDTIIVLEEI
jgi:urea carboxylase